MTDSAAGVKKTRRVPPPVASSISFVLLIAVASACSPKRCKEMGCFGWIRVEYSQPVSTPYDLTVSIRGLTLTARCPQVRREAAAVGSQEAQLECDASSFELSVANDREGTGRYGDNARDADPISLSVSVTPGSPNLPLLKGEVQVRIRPAEPVNGPGCPPICHGRNGVATLAP